MAGIALYELSPDFGLGYLKTAFFVMLHDLDRWEFLKYFPVTIFLNPILPGAELVAAYGLFQLRPWAWKIAVVTLSLNLILRVIGSLNYVIQVMQFANTPILPISEDAVVVQTVSMWPIYIIGIICGISILILVQTAVKEIFIKNNKTQNE